MALAAQNQTRGRCLINVGGSRQHRVVGGGGKGDLVVCPEVPLDCAQRVNPSDLLVSHIRGQVPRSAHRVIELLNQEFAAASERSKTASHLMWNFSHFILLEVRLPGPVARPVLCCHAGSTPKMLLVDRVFSPRWELLNFQKVCFVR